jgi:hypothetical protein
MLTALLLVLLGVQAKKMTFSYVTNEFYLPCELPSDFFNLPQQLNSPSSFYSILCTAEIGIDGQLLFSPCYVTAMAGFSPLPS